MFKYKFNSLNSVTLKVLIIQKFSHKLWGEQLCKIANYDQQFVIIYLTDISRDYIRIITLVKCLARGSTYEYRKH